MATMNRITALALLVALVAPSLLLSESVSAAMYAPQPYVPQFTVALVDRSYDVPTTYTSTTDPFTGKEVTTSHDGYHVVNRTIEITISNQAFSPIDFGNGSVAKLYFSVRMKGHFASWDSYEYSDGHFFKRVETSDSQKTVLTLRFSQDVGDISRYTAEVVIPDNGQEDVQVKAELGYNWWIPNDMYWGESGFMALAGSGWSDIQTLSMPDGTVTVTPFSGPAESPISYTLPTPIPTPTPAPLPTAYLTQNPTASPPPPDTWRFTLQRLDWREVAIVVLAAGFVVLALTVGVLWRRIPKASVG
jgi:hypothetical protein